MHQVARDSAVFTSATDLMSVLDAIKRVQTKDADAFARLYEYYQRPLGRRLLYLVGDREAVEDLYQDTFLRLWKSLPREDSIHNFEAWLYRIASNVAIDHLRRKKKIDFVSLPEGDLNEPGEYVVFGLLSVEGPEEQICEIECIRQALEVMSAQCRVCVLLQDLWGYSQREIVEVLKEVYKKDISEKTVSANVSRGHAQLREAYRRLMDNLKAKKGGQK